MNGFQDIALTGTISSDFLSVKAGPLNLVFWIGGSLALLPALLAGIRFIDRGELKDRIMGLTGFLLIVAIAVLVDRLTFTDLNDMMKLVIGTPY